MSRRFRLCLLRAGQKVTGVARMPVPVSRPDNVPRVSQFLALSSVRASRGHAGDAWFVDLGV